MSAKPRPQCFAPPTPAPLKHHIPACFLRIFLYKLWPVVSVPSYLPLSPQDPDALDDGCEVPRCLKTHGDAYWKPPRCVHLQRGAQRLAYTAVGLRELYEDTTGLQPCRRIQRPSPTLMPSPSLGHLASILVI